jgi:ABC-2 type transport system permease protein
LYFVTWRVAYAVAGRGHVDGANASGFLLVGMFGLITWSSTIWSSGYAIEHERHEGTEGALFLSPVSRSAVVGYGLGSLVWLLPSFLVTIAIGFATGARLHVADPLAVAGAAIALLAASLATGFAFAGLFVLSRRGNLLANFLQLPIYLLAGFLAPRSQLPDWLQPLSDAIPASHAMDALRASGLGGATLHGRTGPLALAFGTAALYALVGWISLRRVENVAKRAGQLDLY